MYTYPTLALCVCVEESVWENGRLVTETLQFKLRFPLFLHQSPPEIEEEKKEGEEEEKEEEGGEEEGEVTDLDILLRREREKEKKRKEGPQVSAVYLFPNCTQIYQ